MESTKDLKNMLDLHTPRGFTDFRVGDTVRVDLQLREGGNERVQAFEGVVIRKKSNTFTVRKVSYGVGVEKIFPSQSPLIKAIKVVKRGKVRRARLYYLRSLKGKAARIKES